MRRDTVTKLTATLYLDGIVDYDYILEPKVCHAQIWTDCSYLVHEYPTQEFEIVERAYQYMSIRPYPSIRRLPSIKEPHILSMFISKCIDYSHIPKMQRVVILNMDYEASLFKASGLNLALKINDALYFYIKQF